MDTIGRHRGDFAHPHHAAQRHEPHFNTKSPQKRRIPTLLSEPHIHSPTPRSVAASRSPSRPRGQLSSNPTPRLRGPVRPHPAGGAIGCSAASGRSRPQTKRGGPGRAGPPLSAPPRSVAALQVEPGGRARSSEPWIPAANRLATAATPRGRPGLGFVPARPRPR